MNGEEAAAEIGRVDGVGDRRLAGMGVKDSGRNSRVRLDREGRRELVVAEEDHVEDMDAPVAEAAGAVVPP